MEDIKGLIAAQLSLYPGMEMEDCIKLLHQSAMGAGHLAVDPQAFCSGLEREMALPELVFDVARQPEPIGNGLCRVHLAALPLGITAPTLAALSSSTPPPVAGEPWLRDALAQLRTMCQQGELPYNPVSATAAIDDYLAAGCPPLHHSGRFRALYHPHYRLLDLPAARLLPVFAAVDKALGERPHVLVGIDGMSCGGKTALAARMAALYGCGVVHADDFFLRPEQRTATRLAQPGGNIDYERLHPIAHMAGDDRPFRYQAYNCQTGTMGAWRQVPGGQLTILEGSYALHPSIAAPCDVRVFLAVGALAQEARVKQRNGEGEAQRFLTEWIPMENRYFSEFSIRESCDVVVDTTT